MQGKFRMHFKVKEIDKENMNQEEFIKNLYDKDLVKTGTVFAGWHDLLGVGATFKDANWSFNDEKFIQLLSSRVRLLCNKLAESQGNEEELTILNDAAMSTLNPDLFNKKNSSRDEILRWLWARFYTHCNTSGIEKDFGFPGLRTIICKGEVLIHRWKPMNVSIKEYDQTRRTTHSYLPFSLQMNTAITKCYIADSFGSKIGLKKGGFYLEESIVNLLIKDYGCKIYDGKFVFLYGLPLLSPVERYKSVDNHHILSYYSAEKVGIDLDRSSWMELGEVITVEYEQLEFRLYEIVAFSPYDESSLLWYDCFNGNFHGFDSESNIDIDTLKATNVALNDKELHILIDFNKELNRFINKNKYLPQFYQEMNNESVENSIEIDGELWNFEETDSGLIIPKHDQEIASKLPNNHHWREKLITGEELRKISKKIKLIDNEINSKGKSPFFFRVYKKK